MKILRKTYYQQDRKKWSGGTTTELFIWPKEAKFSELDFNVRISLATVEVEESIFTKLTGVDRTLTVMEGDHALSINQSAFKQIVPFIPQSFKGDDEVSSTGKALNFNVMSCNDKAHQVNIKTWSSRSKVELGLPESFTFYFVANGQISIGKEELLNGDVVLLTANELVEGIVGGECQLIQVTFESE